MSALYPEHFPDGSSRGLVCIVLKAAIRSDTHCHTSDILDTPTICLCSSLARRCAICLDMYDTTRSPSASRRSRLPSRPTLSSKMASNAMSSAPAAPRSPVAPAPGAVATWTGSSRMARRAGKCGLRYLLDTAFRQLDTRDTSILSRYAYR